MQKTFNEMPSIKHCMALTPNIFASELRPVKLKTNDKITCTSVKIINAFDAGDSLMVTKNLFLNPINFMQINASIPPAIKSIQR